MQARFSSAGVSALTRDVPHVKDILGMIEKSLWIIGFAAKQFGGALEGFLVQTQCTVDIAAIRRDLAHQGQRFRALRETRIAQPRFLLAVR